MEPRGGSLTTTGREVGKASIGMSAQIRTIPEGFEELSISRAVSEIASEVRIEKLIIRNVCNLMQRVELDLWPEKEEGAKYEVIDWQESPTISAALAKGTEDWCEQAGSSLRKDSSGDRPKFVGIINRKRNFAMAGTMISDKASE